MNIRKITLSSFFGLFLLLLTGCQMVVVSNNRLQGMSGVPLMDPDDSGSTSWAKDIRGIDANSDARMPANARLTEPCRIKYHSSYSTNRWMVIEGKLGSEKTYPVILDTGTSADLFVNDIHVIENKLAISPVNGGYDDSVGWGRCRLPELLLGQLTLANWLGFYKEQHMEIQLLGLPLTKDKAIIAGLPALRRFKYIAFDSLNEEVELSLDKVFEPQQPDAWAQYVFSVEEDFGGNNFLIVKIPIAGEETELQLDTGSGKGLAISEELWEKMRENIPPVRLRRGRDLYPYMGSLSCKRGVVPELWVGSRKLTSARISVFPNDSPIVDGCSGLLGMECFQDTTLVLDFERDLIWVKNPSGQ